MLTNNTFIKTHNHYVRMYFSHENICFRFILISQYETISYKYIISTTSAPVKLSKFQFLWGIKVEISFLTTKVNKQILEEGTLKITYLLYFVNVFKNRPVTRAR